MLEKCEIHGIFSNRPCVSTQIATSLRENKRLSFDIYSIFIVIPHKTMPPIIKKCYLSSADYDCVIDYLGPTDARRKGTFLAHEIKAWISRLEAVGRKVLIDRDYVNGESNDGLFIRIEKKRTKLVCPACLHESLKKDNHETL